ncbi:MAG TPA: hypothetical protein VJN70_18720 [Gemmatimonadaceae bacterium]|nr:hypothetical protein [Gemmatimonadaceae bacterium]
MQTRSVLSMVAVLCLVPALARAQEKKVTCSDNTIVTSDAACAHHGGVQKPGGLNKVGKEINKAAIDVKDEAKRTPKNVETGAKTMGHNVGEAAGEVGSGTKKTAKKAGHGVHEAAGDVSKGAHKAAHPRTYRAHCTDGTTWTGHTKSSACKDHGGVANWS